MSLEQITFLAILQGVTEFLPVSSSGHLNLVHLLTQWPDQGLAMDIAVHAGTLGAVVVWFHRDIGHMIAGFFSLLMGRPSPPGWLALWIIVATLPVVVVGWFLLQSGLTDRLRTLEIVATANVVFAVVLFAADRFGETRRLSDLTGRGALAIGLAQILALIPGASRAGVTISMARALGISRHDAARFSMLLSIPVIAGAMTAQLLTLDAATPALRTEIPLAAGLSFLAAMAAIGLFMAMMRRVSLAPFVVYRLALGGFLLVWSLTYGA